MLNSNPTQLAKQEYKLKLSLKDKIERYYQDQRSKYGLKSLDKIKAYLPKKYQPLAIERDIAIAHLDLEPILENIAQNKPFPIVSGLNPSSPLHLGHKVVFDLLLELQKMGGELFIPLTNDESYVDNKVDSIKTGANIAKDKIVPQIKAFGFNEDKTHIFIDTEDHDLFLFALTISKLVKPSLLETLFGEDSLANIGQHFYRGAMQIAQILMPQLPNYGGPRHTLIPVGIDQHPYILLSRDIAKMLGMVPPSELVIKFQPSLTNPEEKMSGSKPITAIYLSDTKKQVESKINQAYTGSVGVLEVHQELGGISEICTVFSLLHNHHPDSKFVEIIREKYLQGSITMSELKKETSDFLNQALNQYQSSVVR